MVFGILQLLVIVAVPLLMYVAIIKIIRELKK